MDEQELIALKERITHLTDEQLLEMIASPDDYRVEALEYAKVVLRERRIDFSQVETQEAKVEDAEKLLQTDVCPVCGGRLRSGTLVAEKELTVVFEDNREERFIRVQACTECGRLSLAVDFETDVER